jgi:diguanylate cyclase (GGDEF)-like protein
LQSGRPAYRNDLSEVDRKSEARLAPEHASAIVVPLRRGNDVLALALIHDESGFFEEVELDLLDELTAVLSAEFEPLADRKGLEHAVRYDSLTGLLNRQGCIDRLQQQIDLQREVARLELALVDLDRFTWINEMRGRDFGDRLLREIARRLTGSRPPADIVARIGADTFAVGRIYQGSADPTALGNHLLGRINEPVYLDAEEIRLTAHVGVAWFPDDAPDANSLLQSAEAALRQAKTDAQRVVQFAPQLDTRIAERLAIETDLHRALDQQQFILHYQPKLDLASGEVVGAEALIRWQHPQRGLIPPSAFIGIAEDLGLILDLGDWVLETACAQQAAWLAAGLRLVPMTVNVSPIQLLRGDLLSSVRRVLARHGLSPRHLELELTETAALPDLPAAHQTLAGLRKLGVGLSLDDFGTGYASLEQIRRFPIDSVKIDRSFIADVTNQTHNNAIVSAIIAMSHALNLRVIAEGVETEAQLAFLRARGCDEMQGFYFRPPLSAGEFAALLDQPTRARLPDITADSRPTILIVDDDSGVRSALGRVLRRDGCRILSTGDGASALDLLALHEVHVVIADQRMPRMDGAQFLAAVKRLYPDTVRIMLSGFTDLAALTAAINRSAVLKFLTKPWIDDELRAEVRDALRHHRRFCSP